MLHVSEHGPVRRFRMSRTFLGRPLWFTAAFWVDGLLIDAGSPACAAEFATALARTGTAVRQLVVTHHHEDHLGMAAAIARRTGVQPRIHPAGLALAEKPPRLPFHERVVWGPNPEGVRCAPLGDTVATERYRFRVIHTPGHAPDHVVLYAEREGWLFTADLFAHPKIKVLRNNEDLGALIASLRQVADLPVSRLFCAHWPEVLPSADLLRFKLRWLEQVAEQAVALHRAGLQETAIRDRILGREGPMVWITRGEWSKLNLIRSALKGAEG